MVRTVTIVVRGVIKVARGCLHVYPIRSATTRSEVHEVDAQVETHEVYLILCLASHVDVELGCRGGKSDKQSASLSTCRLEVRSLTRRDLPRQGDSLLDIVNTRLEGALDGCIGVASFFADVESTREELDQPKLDDDIDVASLLKVKDGVRV